MTKVIEEIITQRLILRGIEEIDTEKIVEWRSDPQVYKYFKSPHRITAEEHLKWFNASYCNNPDRFDWMCIEQSTNEKIGVFGLVKEGEFAEVNYILAPEAQHKGYAKEALNALISYAEKKWRISLIKAEIHKENIPSVELIKRLGFSLNGSDLVFEIYQLELTN